MEEDIKNIEKKVREVVIKAEKIKPFILVHKHFNEAKAIKDIFKRFLLPNEERIKEFAKEIKKVNLTINLIRVYDGEMLNTLVGYTCLINPFFSAVKRAINQLQKSVLKKYNLKTAGTGVTEKFFTRLELDKPDSPELKVFKEYKPFVMEIRDTRDKTEHCDTTKIVEFNPKTDTVTIPIFRKGKDNSYKEVKRIHFLEYMEKTINNLFNLIREVEKVYY